MKGGQFTQILFLEITCDIQTYRENIFWPTCHPHEGKFTKNIFACKHIKCPDFHRKLILPTPTPRFRRVGGGQFTKTFLGENMLNAQIFRVNSFCYFTCPLRRLGLRINSLKISFFWKLHEMSKSAHKTQFANPHSPMQGWS